MNTIPAKNKYPYAAARCRPSHERRDDFSLRHPKMQLNQRAKIFSPFAALKGFEERIDEKLQLYVEKRELTDEEQEALNQTLSRLHALTSNRRAARENHVTAAVRYYVPCSDENHEAYGCGGTYESYTGMVWKVDPLLSQTLLIGDREIELADIAEIVLQEEN